MDFAINADNVTTIVCIILLGLIYLVFAPVTIYGILIQYKDRQKSYIYKRSTLFVTSLIILACIMSMIYIPFTAIEGLLFGFNTTNISETYIYIFLCIPIGYQFIFVVIMRVWLLYYNIHLFKFEKQKIWISVIDSTLESKNWYKKNLNTFGNDKFLFYKIGCIITLITTLLQGFSRFYIHNIANKQENKHNIIYLITSLV